MKQGDIVLIYKKKDPKEIRNYRPITLLNSDYKILTTILAERLKKGLRSSNIRTSERIRTGKTNNRPTTSSIPNARICRHI